MGKQASVVRNGEGEKLEVMGGQVIFLCNAENTGRQWSLMETVLPKDMGPPAHEHPWDEGYYVVEGEVRFKLGDKQTVAKKGDFLYAPGGMLHAFQGTSEKPARVLVFDAPAAAEAFFRDVEKEVKDLPRDLAKVPEIGDRHRIRFVRP